MEWFFAKDNAPFDAGLHDPGVETFKGSLNHYVARETIQNSIDAQRDPKKPVRVEFDAFELPTKEIPDVKNLIKHFNAVGEYWPDSGSKKFAKTASRLLSAREISCLRVSDFNTLGVGGKDGKVGTPWHSLVNSVGASSKQGGEGGSFGIGKNAPVAASALQTVFYSTLSSEGAAFIGVARTGTHKVGRTKHSPLGFLGGGEGKSERNKSKIPKRFLRQEFGTAVFVIGYTESGDWQRELVCSALKNFWPSIHYGLLIVKVGERTIDSGSLEEFMSEWDSTEDFDAHHYFRAVKNTQPIKKVLPELGPVELHLADGSLDLPKKIQMSRATGMVIYEKHFRSMVPFAGLFRCENKDGNRKLRDTEPPRHDEWDGDRYEPKADGRRMLKELNDWLRDEVRALQKLEDSNVAEIPDLYKWLPDDGDDTKAELNGNGLTVPIETADPVPAPGPISVLPLRTRNRKPWSLLDGATNNTDGRDPSGEGETGGAGGGGGGANTNGGGSGGPGNSHENDGESGPGNTGEKPSDGGAVEVKSRVFPLGPGGRGYRVIIVPRRDAMAKIRLEAVADDSTNSRVMITRASTPSGTPFAIGEDGTVLGVTLEQGKSITVDVELESSEKFAFEVRANEA